MGSLKRAALTRVEVVSAIILGSVIGWGCVSSPGPRDYSFRAPLIPADEEASRGRYAEARGRYERILAGSRDPRLRSHALVGIARCHLGERQPQAALRRLSQAQQEAPAGEIPRGMEGLFGDGYFQLGSFQIALGHLERALELSEDPGQSRRIAARIAVCYRKLGYPGQASHYEAKADPVELALLQPPEAPEPQTQPRPRVEIVPRPRPRPAPGFVFRIHPRWEWKAKPPQGKYTAMGPVRRITVHHSGEPEGVWERSFGECADRIRRIQRYHQEERRWSDIGYHYVIDRNGRVWEGRPIRYKGAHAGSPWLNQGNIGVAVLGNFERQRPTDDQKVALKYLLLNLVRRFDISPANIVSHDEIRSGTTDCPGRYLKGYIKALRSTLATGTERPPHTETAFVFDRSPPVGEPQGK